MRAQLHLRLPGRWARSLPEPGHGPQTLSSALLSRLLLYDATITGDKAGTGLWILTRSRVTKPRARIQQWGGEVPRRGLRKMRSLFSSGEP